MPQEKKNQDYLPVVFGNILIPFRDSSSNTINGSDSNTLLYDHLLNAARFFGAQFDKIKNKSSLSLFGIPSPQLGVWFAQGVKSGEYQASSTPLAYRNGSAGKEEFAMGPCTIESSAYGTLKISNDTLPSDLRHYSHGFIPDYIEIYWL